MEIFAQSTAAPKPSRSIRERSLHGMLSQVSLRVASSRPPAALNNSDRIPDGLGGVEIKTAFQPVFSVSHRRIVGFEALARPCDAAGAPVSLRSLAGALDDATDLDRVCCRAHLAAYAAQSVAGSWLFLNIDPTNVVRSPDFVPFFEKLLLRHQLPPHRIVIEILETACRDEAMVADVVGLFRALGCVVAIDDVGAGHSNFERIFRVGPDIIKFDRVVTVASGDRHLRRVLPSLVSVFHEAGCLVVMEGVESEDQALAALDADTDFVQGFYFARPEAECRAALSSTLALELLNERFHQRTNEHSRREGLIVARYAAELERAAAALGRGFSLQLACERMLDLAGVERCFQLDGRGMQLGQNQEARAKHDGSDPRYDPVADASGANWCRRPYFRSAVAQPGRVQASRPYLSIRDRRVCVTLSVACSVGSELRVLCADLDWDTVMR